MIVYTMLRSDGKRFHEKAQVVTFDSGKCIVAWPTSVVIYDSEKAARAVHIDHMGGRGERTIFRAEWGSQEGFRRGMNDAIQDQCEGVWLKKLAVPDYIPEEQCDGWKAGYLTVRPELAELTEEG